MNAKPSIIHIWQSSYPPEIRVGKINETLISHGYAVSVVCRKSNTKDVKSIQVPNEAIVRVEKTQTFFSKIFSLPFPGNPVWTSVIKNEINRTKPSAIIVRDIPLFINANIARSKNSKIKLILDMAEHYPAAMRSWKKYNSNPILKLITSTFKIPDIIEKYSVNNADHIFVVCDEQKERLISQYKCVEEKITVVRNTPDISKAHFKNVDTSKASSEDFWIGYHGILCADRQLDYFIKGFALAAKKQKNIKLLIAGGGETEQDLRELSKKLELDSCVKFTGRYTPNDLPALYGACHAGVVSLEKNEFTMHTLANKFFDYAALKMPFVYTDLKPLTTLMTEMNCGVSYEAANEASICESILKLYNIYVNNPSQFETMGHSGRNAVDTTYNWSEDSRRLMATISKVCE